MMYRIMVIVWLLLAGPVAAQETPAVITANTIEQLQSVVTIDFDSLPAEAGEIINGRVYINDEGSHLAAVNRSGQVVFWDVGGNFLDVTAPIFTEDGFPATFIDGAFDAEGSLFVAVYSAGGRYVIASHQLQGTSEVLTVESDNNPAAVWIASGEVWLEIVPAEAGALPFIAHVPLPFESETVREGALATLPFVSAQDEDVIVRVGRLMLPLDVTVVKGGLVKRWNLQTAELTASVALDEVPIYGHITPDGRYLLWRDPMSEAMHVLDFDAGEDRVVVELDGTYIPFLFLTPDASAAVGVYVNDEPVVVGWDVERGQRYDLGQYRQCQRPPDMVRLSRNAKTLVVGCDTGLDVWQVP